MSDLLDELQAARRELDVMSDRSWLPWRTRRIDRARVHLNRAIYVHLGVPRPRPDPYVIAGRPRLTAKRLRASQQETNE